MTVLAIVAVVSQYAYFATVRLNGGRQIETWGNAVPHLSVLLFILAAAFGWGYYLDRYGLLYSTTGVVYGVGYTAAHVTMIALWIMIGVSAAACALLVLNFFRPRWKAMAIGAGTYAALYVVGILLVPALFQTFVVQPNELRLETPYLESYIAFTRKAYNLDAIQETSYPATGGSDARKRLRGIKAPFKTFVSGIRVRCFRPISRLKPYVSTISSTT